VVNPLDHRIIFSTPRRLARISAWREHIPFGMFLVDILRPRTLIELGTHTGNSYCAFCQAVDELQLSTQCHAIDTWRGDSHTGAYGPEVLADLRAHHDPLYGEFSTLVQSTFDEALELFSDGTIDLLHIDGLHTYNAIKHDVEAWIPKLSDRGVLVLHDIDTRRPDYGVWRLWETLKATHSHFELHHGYGLGVLAVGPAQTDEFRELLSLPDEAAGPLRQLFFTLGYRLRLQLQVEDARTKLVELRHSVANLGQEVASLRQERDSLRRERDSIQQERDGALAQARTVRAELAQLRGRRVVRAALKMSSLGRPRRQQ
jgi:hypothetical protein